EPPAAEEGDDEKDAERPKVLLTCYSRQRETDGMGERGAGILGLLRPALATGFAARLRRRRMRRVVEVGFDSARDGLLLTTLEGRALFANEAMSDLLRRDPDGTSVQTVIGRVV